MPLTRQQIIKRRIRRRFESLTIEQRREIADGYHRHLRACEKARIAPDPMWLVEAVEEAAGRRPVTI